MTSVSIGTRTIGPGEPVFVIAEAGVNHNGDPDLARSLIRTAADAGADAIKFQCFSAADLVAPGAPKAAYQVAATDPAESQYEMLKRLDLPRWALPDLRAHARSLNLVFLATPFDKASLDLLVQLGVPAIKVGSGELTNLPFLEAVARKNLPIILSTGMATLDEVAEAVAVLRASGNGSLILLHCVSCYPTEPGELNLRAITTLAQTFDCPAGFSDHTLGINAAIAAVALGACVVEKHLTTNRSLPGPDHCASLEPEEFRAMVLGIRDTERSLGTGEKRPVPREIEVAQVVRRSVVAAVEIPAGARLDEAMLALRRPGTGLPPKAWETLLGRRAKRTIRAGEPITGECVD